MQNLTVKKKNLLMAFIGYVATTVALSIGLSMAWQAGLDMTNMTHEKLVALAQDSWLLNHGSKVIGAAMAILISVLLAVKAKGIEYRTCLYFGLILIAYGVLSIVLNPHHGIFEQTLKIITPIPLTLFGAWIAKRLFNDHSELRSANV